MCYIVLPQTPVRKLLGAAQHLQQLVDDGTIAAASVETAPEAAYRTISAFDVLNETARAVSAEQKAVSPFIRYRREILAETPMGSRLRSLVFCLREPASPYSLNRLFLYADDYHKRIVLDLIASYANRGEADPHFMSLASEIADFDFDEAAA